MPTVRMKVEADGSLATLSQDNPDAVFRILTSISTNKGHTTLVEIEALSPDIIDEYLETDQRVIRHQILDTDDRKTIVQFSQESEPAAGRAGQQSGNPPPYPLILRDGWIHAESTTTHEHLSEFKTHLDTAGIDYELLSVTQTHTTRELLTDRQSEFVTEALDRGYYDSPRQCSLTDIATALDVNKATASGILHRAESAIIKEFMNESAHSR